MPHECGELHEVGCRITVVAVPSEQPSDGEAVPQMVCRRWPRAVGNRKAKFGNQRMEGLADRARIEGPPAGEREHWVVRRQSSCPLRSHREEVGKTMGQLRPHRDEPRLRELRLTDGQNAAFLIDILATETRDFADAQAKTKE